jgi:hypothetical protein
MEGAGDGLERTRHTVTPEHAKTSAAKTRHTATKKQQNTNRKKTGVRRNTTKNSHQTNTQEDKDQSYITTGTTGRTADLQR